MGRLQKLKIPLKVTTVMSNQLLKIPFQPAISISGMGKYQIIHSRKKGIAKWLRAPLGSFFSKDQGHYSGAETKR